MYTIKQAAARVGLSVDVLRAWERRYGIVEPRRTPAGYRLYDEAAIGRLSAMRRLVDAGWSPATAAAALLDPAAPPPNADPVRMAAAEAASGGAAASPSNGAETTRFVAAAASLDQAGIAAALDDMFGVRSVERSLADEVYPALRELGGAWSRGEVSVAGEHLASHAVLRRLAAAFEAAASPSDGPRVVVGLPPGSRHELGVLGFAIVARRSGLRVTYLGPDLPIDDWIAGTDGAAAAVVGVPTPGDRAAADGVVRALAAARRSIVIATGGAGATPLAGAIVLPPDLVVAASAVRAAIGRAGSR